MNSKITKYVLVTSAVFVWGSILYKVIAGLNHEEKKQTTPLVKASFSVLKRDSFNILANYPDPFLPNDGVYEADLSLLDSNVKSSNINEQTSSPPQIHEEKPVDISFIKYTGNVSNPERKVIIGFINIRGRDFLVKERDSVDGIEIMRITVDKIWLAYQKKKFVIKKTTE